MQSQKCAQLYNRNYLDFLPLEQLSYLYKHRTRAALSLAAILHRHVSKGAWSGQWVYTVADKGQTWHNCQFSADMEHFCCFHE